MVERLRFTNSGSEAVMMAFRTARALTGKNGILRFEGSYHGIYDAALPAGAAGIPDVVYGDLYDTPVADEAAFLQALDEHGDRLACVIIDLMPNRAGLKPVPQAFADLGAGRDDAARDPADRRRGDHAAPRAVGPARPLRHRARPGDHGQDHRRRFRGRRVGRTGRRDGRARPARAGNVPHAGTFSANPVTCAAGLAALDLLDQAAIDRINAQGDRLREAVAALGYNVAGSGSLFRLLDILGDYDAWWRLYTRRRAGGHERPVLAVHGDDRGRRRGDRGALRRRAGE